MNSVVWQPWFYAIFDLEQLFIRMSGELIEGLYGFQDGYCTVGSTITVILSILLHVIIPRIWNESEASLSLMFVKRKESMITSFAAILLSFCGENDSEKPRVHFIIFGTMFLNFIRVIKLLYFIVLIFCSLLLLLK